MNALKTLGSWKIETEHSRNIRRLLLTQVVWLVILMVALQLQSLLTFERLFVPWYVGFIVAVHLFAPRDVKSRWWRGVQIIVIAGFIGLCYFVARRAAEIISI